MNEILDQPDQPKTTKNRKKSWSMLKYTSLMLAFSAGIFVLFRRSENGIFAIGSLLSLGTALAFSCFGIFYGINSYLEKEPPSKKRIWTLIANAIIAGLLISVVIKAGFDIYRFG